MPKVESTVVDALLRHLRATAHDSGADATPDGDLTERLAGDFGRAQCVHDPDGLVVPVTKRPVVVLPEGTRTALPRWDLHVHDG
jgi:hypothetical protein